MPVAERAYPIGHPASPDFDPNSPEAKAWLAENVHPAGELAYPVNHPAHPDNYTQESPTNPLHTARDFSRPETIPPREYEAVTGRNHADDVRDYHAREEERRKKEQAKREALARLREA
jgi:hypothetical protein